jgi:hypothetical protein
MKTKKQIRHTYTKYLVIYLNMVDALKFEAADRWYLRAETLATEVLNRDICHDADRLINARARQQLQALYKKVFE